MTSPRPFLNQQPGSTRFPQKNTGRSMYYHSDTLRKGRAGSDFGRVGPDSGISVDTQPPRPSMQPRGPAGTLTGKDGNMTGKDGNMTGKGNKTNTVQTEAVLRSSETSRRNGNKKRINDTKV